MSTRHAETGQQAGGSTRDDSGHRQGRRHQRAQDGNVQRITSAPEGGHVERDARFVRYAWQMAIRTACFVLAFFTTGWVQVVFFIAAIVLPYVAVVLANNGTVSNGEVLDAVRQDPPATPELGSRLELTAGPQTLQGETTDERHDGNHAHNDRSA